jgi:predicted RNase H-like HicB family nuclease
MTAYIALLRKDPDSDYSVDFPDFPGCVTAGTTLEEARRMAAEALAGHVGVLAEEGEPIPEPSNLDAIMSDPDNRDAIAFLVDLPERSSRVLRVNITAPESDLRTIDVAAEREGMTRSGFVIRAARERAQRIVRDSEHPRPPSRRRSAGTRTKRAR